MINALDMNGWFGCRTHYGEMFGGKEYRDKRHGTDFWSDEAEYVRLNTCQLLERSC